MALIAFFELDEFGLGNRKDYIRKRLKGHTVSFVSQRLEHKTAKLAKTADVAAFFIYSHVDANLLKQLPKLKLVTTMSTGYDHIDMAACKKRKVLACNVPSYGENTVAEHAMALLLAISRNIIPSIDRTRKGKFSFEGLRGFDLKGKTIGIIGTGRIGRHMAHYANAFGMNVIAYDLFPNKELAKECGFVYVALSKLLKRSDVLSLHLPETPQTHHIINCKNIRKIKNGCVLINTARGKLVETEALLLGLKNGTFKACGLDVLEEETAIQEEASLLHKDFAKKYNVRLLLEEHALQGMDNVLITPHNAFNSDEALQRILDTTLDNILAFLKKKAQNVVK
ncbi:MAG TPA: NAD(P)-dependent oxidoreductase [Candidatus Nanoarchaeia archaeon]|nr:NAD(P)-dependent oxidoreductase [Candidatus Nanoarchaeia archaeon]